MASVYTKLSQLAGANLSSEILEYAERVRSTGNLVSLQYAKLLNSFWNNDYEDGFGGTGKISELKDKFTLLWCPGSFGEVTTPVIGDALLSEGFVQSNFTLTSGLKSNFSQSLLIQIVMSDLDPSDCHISCRANAGSVSSFRPVLGAMAGDNFIGFARESSNTAICEFGSAKVQVADTLTNGLFTMNLTTDNTLRYYHNQNVQALPGSSASAIASDLPIRLFARTESTSIRYGNHSSDFVSIGKALTIQEINVLNNAVQTLRANRFTLAGS